MPAKDPGLDPRVLQALRQPRRSPKDLLDRIADHLDQHDGYVSWSGGKDSLVCVHLARQVDPRVPVVFIDSGLEYPETLDHIQEVADLWRLNLTVLRAQPTALEILADSGYWDHQAPVRRGPSLHTVLIEVPSRQAHSRFGQGRIWGLRADESTGRQIGFARGIPASCTCCVTPADRRARHGGLTTSTTYSPVWDWTTPEVWAWTGHYGLPVNPVYARLQALGVPVPHQRVSLMLSGAHLEIGAATWLRRGWPDITARLQQALPRLTEYF